MPISDKTLYPIAARYVELNDRISTAETAEERIAARNALIADPLCGRIYESPFNRAFNRGEIV